MLWLEYEVHLTCRADVGRWRVVRAPVSDTNGVLRVTRDVPAPGPDREIATVAATSDLRLADNDDGFEDETGRANASLISDAPELLLALAQLVDAAYLLGTPHPDKDRVLERALNRACRLLEAHADIQRAVRRWEQALLGSAEDVQARIDQMHNGEE